MDWSNDSQFTAKQSVTCWNGWLTKRIVPFEINSGRDSVFQTLERTVMASGPLVHHQLSIINMAATTSLLLNLWLCAAANGIGVV